MMIRNRAICYNDHNHISVNILIPSINDPYFKHLPMGKIYRYYPNMYCIHTDPYFKETLLHADNKTIKTRKTTVKKNIIDPIYNETISLNVTPDILEDCSLHVGVWDFNTKSKDYFMEG